MLNVVHSFDAFSSFAADQTTLYGKGVSENVTLQDFLKKVDDTPTNQFINNLS
jgi:hypothetical protein